MRRTKIVATIGPATRDLETLARLIGAGADVLRLNFSHGTRDEHAATAEMARRAAERAGREIALLGDLPGPKLRVGKIEGGIAELAQGREVVLTTASVTGTPERIPVAWPSLARALHAGDPVYLADGSIRLRVREIRDGEVLTAVEVGGCVASRQGVNLPSVDAGLPAGGEQDLDWVDFAVEHGLDLLALSFVRSAADLEPVERRLAERGADLPLIAKIEKPQAADNAVEIVAAAAGIMVARGDLGIELPIERVPLVQKQLLALAGFYSKPSITATQVLASMVRSPRPTRAEATDVANAIFDGSDAIMLSEETAVGDYPVEAVSTVATIARETEEQLPYGVWLLDRTSSERDIADTVAHGAVGAASQLGLAALVVPTRSGRTARLVSAHRPKVPVLALSQQLETVRRLNLLFGVIPVLNEEPGTLNELLESSAIRAREAGLARSGDMVGITAGLPEQRLGTNLFEVHRVP